MAPVFKVLKITAESDGKGLVDLNMKGANGNFCIATIPVEALGKTLFKYLASDEYNSKEMEALVHQRLRYGGNDDNCA